MSRALTALIVMSVSRVSLLLVPPPHGCVLFHPLSSSFLWMSACLEVFIMVAVSRVPSKASLDFQQKLGDPRWAQLRPSWVSVAIWSSLEACEEVFVVYLVVVVSS